MFRVIGDNRLNIEYVWVVHVIADNDTPNVPQNIYCDAYENTITSKVDESFITI